MNKKLVITRSKWARGDSTGKYSNYLLNRSDKMCCLGFAGKQLCDLPDERLLDSGTPAHLGNAFCNGLSWLLEEVENDKGEPTGDIEDSLDCQHLMDTNDNGSTSDAEKEAEIIKVFAEHGVDVTFED